MEKVVPWGRLIALIEPCYPKRERGRPPIGIERMLRIYFLAQWYGLADEALEDAIYDSQANDSQAARNFIGVDLGGESVPDATTLLKFRHLLEENDLTRAIFEAIGMHRKAKKLLMKEGTIINAPSSTKNAEGKRDPQMHQTRKGNQWHFGMKAHIGADAESGLVHSLVATSANVSDVSRPRICSMGRKKEFTPMRDMLGFKRGRSLRETRLIGWWHRKRDTSGEWERRKAQVRSKVELT